MPLNISYNCFKFIFYLTSGTSPSATTVFQRKPFITIIKLLKNSQHLKDIFNLEQRFDSPLISLKVIVKFLNFIYIQEMNVCNKTVSNINKKSLVNLPRYFIITFNSFNNLWFFIYSIFVRIAELNTMNYFFNQKLSGSLLYFFELKESFIFAVCQIIRFSPPRASI